LAFGSRGLRLIAPVRPLRVCRKHELLNPQ
jgi:hypothetical protein